MLLDSTWCTGVTGPPHADEEWNYRKGSERKNFPGKSRMTCGASVHGETEKNSGVKMKGGREI